jgi:thymidine kinase
MINSGKKGKLEVVCGPMFSGKSEELIRRLRRAIIAKQHVAVFKPAIDDRYGLEQVRSHNGTSIDAYPVEKVQLILQEIEKYDYNVIGLDEVQFFPAEIINVICTLVDKGLRVICAGLDLDFRGVPFGPMPTLLAIADEITKFQSICTKCNGNAHFTQRLVNNKPAKFDDPIIMVGAQEKYEARCRNCFIIDKAPGLWQNQP